MLKNDLSSSGLPYMEAFFTVFLYLISISNIFSTEQLFKTSFENYTERVIIYLAEIISNVIAKLETCII